MKNYEDWLEISDIEKFTEYVRNVVYINFRSENIEEEEEEYDIDFNEAIQPLSDEENLELNSILTQKECINIIKETSKKIRHKKTKEIKYLINNKILYKIIQNINQRMVSNMISNLVKKGLLESAFDEEKNDFVFWKKDTKDGNS
jgi:hypothetical protein